MTFPPLQLAFYGFSDEVRTLLTIVQNRVHAVKGALREACRNLLVIDLFPTHTQIIDDITNCYKSRFCRYHLLRVSEYVISSKYRNGRRQ